MEGSDIFNTSMSVLSIKSKKFPPSKCHNTKSTKKKLTCGGDIAAGFFSAAGIFGSLDLTLVGSINGFFGVGKLNEIEN